MAVMERDRALVAEQRAQQMRMSMQRERERAEAAAKKAHALAARAMEEYQRKVVDEIKAGSQVEEGSPHIKIELDRDGQLVVDGRPMDLKTLTATLKDAHQEGAAKLSIEVRADQQCLFRDVAAVLSQCRDLGITNIDVRARSPETQ
jgi:biopolymer transport protein ExbD